MNTQSDTTLMTLARLVTQRLDPHTIPATSWPEVITIALQQGLGPMLLR